jgi:glutamine synthetase
MPKYKLEYIWLDGYTPLASLRSKTQIKEYSSFPKLDQLPLWGFDGSSTQQAEGKTRTASSSRLRSIPTSPARTACW